MLGVPDAYQLPGRRARLPGTDKASSCGSEQRRLRALPPRSRRRRPGGRASCWRHAWARPSDSARPTTLGAGPGSWSTSAAGETIMEARSWGGLEGKGPAAYRIWLPPLGANSAALNRVLPGETLSGQRHAGGPLPRQLGRGPTGRCGADRRRRQAASSSGATRWWRAGRGGRARRGRRWPAVGQVPYCALLILILALTHSPSEVLSSMCLDFGGGASPGSRELPHVGGVAGRGTADAGTAHVAELDRAEPRERGSLRRDLIRWRSSGGPREGRGPPKTGYGDVFLVIDGWATSIRGDFEDLEPEIHRPRHPGPDLRRARSGLGDAVERDARPRGRTNSATEWSCGSATPPTRRWTSAGRRWVEHPRRRPAAGASSPAACSSSLRCPDGRGGRGRGPGTSRVEKRLIGEVAGGLAGCRRGPTGTPVAGRAALRGPACR